MQLSFRRILITVPASLFALALTGPFAIAQELALELVAEGLTAPIHLEQPDDGSGRTLIVQQDGVVRVLGADGTLQVEPFLDLRPRMLPLEEGFEERGLLGFTLHPLFGRNGRVFATYSAPLRASAPQAWNHTRRISEFSAKPGDLSRIDAASERILMEIDWPSRKHNGGGLALARMVIYTLAPATAACRTASARRCCGKRSMCRPRRWCGTDWRRTASRCCDALT